MEMIFTETFRDIYWSYVAFMVLAQFIVGWKFEKGIAGMLIVQSIFLLFFPIIVPYLIIMRGG